MKKLSLFRNTDKKTESAPDYRLVASYQDASGAWVNETVGSFWKPKSDNPKAPALSGHLSDAREFNNTQYPGYKIVPEGVVTPKADPIMPEYPADEINPNDVPF